jgi:hypothetical protein
VEEEFLAVFRDTVLNEAEGRIAPDMPTIVDDIAARRDDPYSVTERLAGELFVPAGGEP